MSSDKVFFDKMSYEDRMRWIGEQVVATDSVLDIDKLCRKLWRMSGLLPEGDAAFVFGETGAGKSTGVAAFADAMADELEAAEPGLQWLRPDVPGTTIRPIWMKLPSKKWLRPLVVVVVNPKPNFKSLMRDTARALNLGLAVNFDPGQAMTQIQDHLVEQKVKLIVFDEVQHITQSRMDDYSAADVIKMLAKTRVQVLCVGLEECRDLLEEEKKGNEQLDRLKAREVTVEPLPCSLNDFPPLGRDGRPVVAGFPVTAFRKFCFALDDRSDRDAIVLPFDRSSDISHPNVALRLWRAYDGYVGKMMKFLFWVTDEAITEGRRSITLDVMANVFRDQQRCDDEDNWFLMKWPEFTKRFEAGSRTIEKGNENDRDGDQSSNRASHSSLGVRKRKSLVLSKR